MQTSNRAPRMVLLAWLFLFSPLGQASPIEISDSYDLLTLEGATLSRVTTLPAGSVIEVDPGTDPVSLPTQGQRRRRGRATSGFLPEVVIQSVPQTEAGAFPAEEIERLNSLSGGLYISSSVLGDLIEAVIPVKTSSEPGPAYLHHFRADGRPLQRFTGALTRRFGALLNARQSTESLSNTEVNLWSAIHVQMQLAANRLEPTPAKVLFIPPRLARGLSSLFETEGKVQIHGAWTIAVRGTARRHRFAHAPCAEFVSEVIRQAYARVGASHLQHFSEAGGNPLFWKNTAAVQHLASALAKAGWVPWDAADYKPPTGAVLMHGVGLTPGHTYLAAGDDGRIVVDNGSPRGRDLRSSPERWLKLMYRVGVFFTVPTVIPERWPEDPQPAPSTPQTAAE